MTSNCMLSVLSVVIVLISAISAAPPAHLPPSFDKCELGPKFDECVAKAIEKAIRSIAKGYQPLGILPVDPLEISAIDIDQGNGPVSIALKFKNIHINGLRNTKILSFVSDMDKLVFTAKANIAKVQLKGPYTVDGKVLILPIKGDGEADIGLEDILADIKIVGKQYKKEGNTFMKITNFDFQITETKKLKINLTNLFNGDKALGNNMNKFLNENGDDIFKELRPAVESAFGAAFREISNRIFTKVSFEEIFPPKH